MNINRANNSSWQFEGSTEREALAAFWTKVERQWDRLTAELEILEAERQRRFARLEASRLPAESEPMND